MRRSLPAFVLAGMLPGVCPGVVAAQVPEGYVAGWADEFQASSIDTATWEVLTRRDSFNNEKQYYLPNQAGIVDGDFLRITATDEPIAGKQYRSARLESFPTVLYGRVEARAKIPTTKGIWPAIWMFPNRGISWPLGGEIDIMEHGGSNPFKVSSAYHWNDQPNFSQFVFNEVITDGNNGTPVIAWPDDFHVYATEWDPHEIRYYVDGFHHFSVVDPSVPAGFLPGAARMPVSSTPMNVILNTAVGGNFDGDPDGSTVFPQHFDIDYVRTYQRDPAAKLRLRNGDFRQFNSDWFLEGNSFLHLHDEANSPAFTALDGPGDVALKLFADGGFGTTATQYLWLDTDQTEINVAAHARVNSDDSIAGTNNRVDLSITFFGQNDNLLGNQAVTLADGSSEEDTWLRRTLDAVIPDDAVYAKLILRFLRPSANQNNGAVWVDGLTLAAAALLGDYNDSGQVEQGDLDLVLQNWGVDSTGNVPVGWTNDLPDGVIEQSELDAVLSNWGGSAAPDFSGSSVPEPAAAALLGALATGWPRRLACR